MGGQSSSGLAPAEDGSGAVWTGARPGQAVGRRQMRTPAAATVPPGLPSHAVHAALSATWLLHNRAPLRTSLNYPPTHPPTRPPAIPTQAS